MNRTTNFETAVSTIRSAARRHASRNGRVSSVDVVGVARTLRGIRGSTRGAAVSTAFRQLVDEKILRPTTSTVYNKQTKHSVVIYRTV